MGEERASQSERSTQLRHKNSTDHLTPQKQPPAIMDTLDLLKMWTPGNLKPEPGTLKSTYYTQNPTL